MGLSEHFRRVVRRMGAGDASSPSGFTEPPKIRRQDIVVVFGLILIFWIVTAVQWPLHDLVVPWDSKNQFYAFFRFMAETIHQGATPFWNPYHYAGHPSIADPQSMIFSPAFVLWALVDPKPSLFAFDLMVFAHLLIGGIALARYGLRKGWPAAACVLSAMIFMIGGAVSGRMMHVGIINAYALFPLALLWMDVAIDRRSRLAAIGFGAITALIVLGRSQVPLLLCFVLAVLLASRFAREPGAWRYLIARLEIIAIAAITTLALIAVPMLLTLQFADFSNRPHMGIEETLRSSLYPANLANFFVPDVFGSLRPLSEGNWGPAYWTRPDVDSTDRAFNYLFAGTLTALLLVWHGVVGRRAFKSEARVFLCIGIVALMYSLGRYTPLFPFLFQHVPGIDLFRRPVGGTFILLLALAYLSGHLASDYVREGPPRVSRSGLAIAVATVAGLLVWAIAFSMRSGKGWESTFEIGKAAPVYIGLVILLLWPKTRRARALAMSLAVLFTASDLISHNAANVLNAEPRADYALLEAPSGDAAKIINAIKNDAATTLGGSRARVEIVGLGGPWRNASMLFGLEATNGYNPLRIGPYDRLVSPGEDTYTPLNRRFPASFPGYDCLLGRLLGLEYLVLDRPIDQIPALARREVASAVMTGPKAWIYHLANAAPRVTVDMHVKVADAAEFIDAGKFPSALGASEVLVDSDDPITQKYAIQPIAPAQAKIVGWRPDRVEIEVNTAAPSVMTLHDLWYPGWEVEVDGVRKPLLRTDVLFRGVETPAGRHTVVFEYRPLSFENLSSIVKGLIESGD